MDFQSCKPLVRVARRVRSAAFAMEFAESAAEVQRPQPTRWELFDAIDYGLELTEADLAGAALDASKGDAPWRAPDPPSAAFDTLLIRSVRRGRADVVSLLLRDGALVDGPKKGGVTPLYVACQEGHIRVVDTLLAGGADVNRVKRGGATPLWIACQEGHMQVVMTLVAKGAAVNQARSDGTTPLYIASQNNHMEVVAALMAEGADVSKARRPTPRRWWRRLLRR